jgi:two-component SAPR family response regulator
MRPTLTARRRCMIVEDQVLIGMALQVSLDEAGFETAGPFLSNAASLRWLHANTPELALLDVLLKDGPCVQLARELKSRGIPFAIYSGLPSAADAPEELRDVPWLEKPVSRETLATTLDQLTCASGSNANPTLSCGTRNVKMQADWRICGRVKRIA